MKHFFWLVMLIIIAFVVYIFLGPLKFFIDVGYHDPDAIANTNFLKAVESYDGQVVSSEGELRERLLVFDDYFDNATPPDRKEDTVTEINTSHVQALFGEADQIISFDNMPFADKVYQYDIGHDTLSFHEKEEAIIEYVLEDVSDEAYDKEELDALFLSLADTFYQSDKSSEGLFIEDYPHYINHLAPSRKIQQNGWNFPIARDKFIHYFDTGETDSSPINYLGFIFWETFDGVQLRYMERHLGSELDTSSHQFDAIQETFNEFDELLAEDDDNPQILQLIELIDAFGPMRHIHYSYRISFVDVSWAFHNGNEWYELTANVELDPSMELKALDDLNKLKVSELEFKPIKDTDYIINTHAFIANE
ncbi:hypothetical protein ACF3NG_02860 [Aerococcaceae bacterium WGS1372]